MYLDIFKRCLFRQIRNIHTRKLTLGTYDTIVSITKTTLPVNLPLQSRVICIFQLNMTPLSNPPCINSTPLSASANRS